MAFPLKVLKLSAKEIRELAEKQFALSYEYEARSSRLREDGNNLVALAVEKEESK